MAVAEVLLAVLQDRPRHGYEIKHEHDAWFPDARPLAFGQVYATLGRLDRDGCVQVRDVGSAGAAERTVYAMTPTGQDRLTSWLTDAVNPTADGTDELVRKVVAVLRTGVGAADFVARQRATHLRRIRELGAHPPDDDVVAELVRERLIAHLDADLRWLDRAAELIPRADRSPR